MTNAQPNNSAVAWRGGSGAPEPPAHIRYVRDGHGDLADRLDEPCDYCPDGSLWRWRHNGGTECWLDIDGYSPWEGWLSEPLIEETP